MVVKILLSMGLLQASHSLDFLNLVHVPASDPLTWNELPLHIHCKSIPSFFKVFKSYFFSPPIVPVSVCVCVRTYVHLCS